MDPHNSPTQEAYNSHPKNTLEEMVHLTVTGYLKNNFDKSGNPLSRHFTEGLRKSIESGIQLKNPNSKDAKIKAFLAYLNKDEDKEEGRLLKNEELLSLIEELAEDFSINISSPKKVEELAESLYQSEILVLKKRGQGGDIEDNCLSSWEALDEDQKEKYRHSVVEKREDQVESIKRWIRYVASDEVTFPIWYRYYIILSLRSMGVEQFELGTYTYGKRDHKTLFRFPTLNQAVLAKVYARMSSAFYEENYKKPIPSKYEIQDAARTSIDEAEKLFLEKYAKEANFAQLYAYELSKYKEATLESRRSHEGIWIKYNQQEEGSEALKKEAQKLSNSLLDKGTSWCTEQTNFSESQLAGGNFYVYYTREDFNKESHSVPLEDMTEDEKKILCTMPRIAIKMYNGQISELRGIVGGAEQDLEPDMVSIAQAKIEGDKEKGEEPLGGWESYAKKARDMKRLTALVEKGEKEQRLDKDDLIFLYEVGSRIEGFGHNTDPRIKELKKRRNRNEDIITMCNCVPEYIAHDFMDIASDTLVYCEDDGTTITLLDYRKEGNKDKKAAHLELAKKIKETGSPAQLDMSFYGGLVDITFDKEKVKDTETAIKSFKEADSGSASYVWEELEKLSFVPPQGNSLAVIVLSYNKDSNTRKSSDKIVADMETLGLRPLTFEETVIAGIYKPEFCKTNNRYYIGLTKYTLGGDSLVPILSRYDDERWLNADGWDIEWDGRARFLCVRK